MPVTALHPQAARSDRERSLLWRGQFVLGPSRADQLQGWTSYAAAGGLWLTAHPELPVTTLFQDIRALTLIGFILDPGDPSADDAVILTKLFASCASIGKLAAATAGLGGRWAMVAACDDGLYLFTDALGLRQALHTLPTAASGLWVVSQAGLAIDVLGGTLDEQAVQFMDSDAFRAHAEYRWPGTSTPAHGLRHLLPNHFLDLHTGKVTRYWPDAALATLSVEEAVPYIATLVTGMMLAAARRFELALALTAGIDSRLVLAAARPIADRISYVTVRQAKMADGCDDLRVPARLLAKLGLRHEIVPAAGSASADFSWAFKRSVFLAHDHYAADAEAILAWFDRRKVAVTGSGAEIGRCSFRQSLPFSALRRITAADLAGLQRLNHPYAIRFFEEWLADVGECTYVKLPDLFEWEQGHGNWLAMTQLEFDIAWRDIFTPYNCRALLTAFLGVNERFRRGPDYTFFKLAIRRLWAEVLCEPINPHTRARTFRRPLNLLRRLWHA